MVDYSALAGFGEGLREGLKPYIEAEFQKNQKRNTSRDLAKKLIAMSSVPDGFTDDDKDILSREIGNVIDPNTLQNVLNYAGAGEGPLQINLDGEGNQLRDSNIYWKIPALDPNRTQQDRKRGAWLSYHEAVNKSMADGAMSLEEASTKIIRDMLKKNPSQVATIHEYINGTTAKTYEARQRIASTAGLLNANKDQFNRVFYTISSSNRDELFKRGLLDTVEKQNLDPNSIEGKARLMQIILFDRNSPAYQAYNVYAYRGLTAGSEATMQALEQSNVIADKRSNAFELGMQNALQEDTAPASSRDIPRDIMIKMQKENVMNPVALNNLLTNAGQPPEIVIRRMATRYVPDDSQQELRELIYRYLYSLAEGD